MGFTHRIKSCFAGAAIAAGWLVALAAPSHAALDFRLAASNIEIDIPSPLFTTADVQGMLTLTDTVTPGSGFGLADIIGFSFNFAGITVTLADTQQPGAALTVFGNRAADGASLSFLDLRFDLPPSAAFCSLICAGQVQIGTFDRSNFVAIDDPDAATTSLLMFDATLTAVPAPASLALLASALIGLGVLRPRPSPAKLA